MYVFSKSVKDQIVEMYQAGGHIEDIIREFNQDEHSIRLILKERQLDRQYNKFSDELYIRIIHLYRDLKCTQKKICYDLLISSVGIKKTLNRNGINLRQYSENNRRYHRNQHYFDVIDTPNKAYILGLLYADGNNFYDGNCRTSSIITIALQEQDKQLLECIRNEIEYEGPLHHIELSKKNPLHKNQYALVVNDTYMSQRLIELGVVKAKSLIITWPTFLEENLVRHFVRGYFDGDGCITQSIDCNKRKYTTSVVGTIDFCCHLKNELDAIGCKSHLYHPKECKPETYTLRTSATKSSMIFTDWIYHDSDIKMERKYQRYLELKERYNEINLKRGNDPNK